MYKEMYYHLFNAVSKAVEQPERGEDQAARIILIQAQQETEGRYLDGVEPVE